jgi:putative transposase
MKQRYTEEEISEFLKEAQAGVQVTELYRKHGFSGASFYEWRAKSGGLQLSDTKSLGRENAQLERLLAESLLEREALLVALRGKY